MLQDAWIAAAVGVAVAGTSALIAWAGLRWSMHRPGTMMVAVLGGTMVRLVLVGGASVLLLLYSDVHQVGYAAGLIAAYLVFLGIEIALVARSAGRKG
ncbi:MAG: hypothetical protein O2782_08795 [bacterium]|nr:hypothetical protein [bacterium]